MKKLMMLAVAAFAAAGNGTIQPIPADPRSAPGNWKTE